MNSREFDKFWDALVRYGKGEATKEEVLELNKPVPLRTGSVMDIDLGDVGEWQPEDAIEMLVESGELTEEQREELFGPNPWNEESADSTQ